MLSALFVLSTALAAPWHVPERDRRLQLEFTNPGTANLSNFPFLVKLDDTRVDYAQAQSDGFDLRFVDSSGSDLDFAIDHWDPSDDSFVWVRLPSLDASATDHVWMYYGSQTPVVVDPSDPNGVWVNTWLGVWDLSGPNEVRGDYPGTYTGNDDVDVDGPIGVARYFSGDDQIVVGGNDNDFDIDQLTISAWVRRDGWNEIWSPVFTKGDDAWRLHRRNNTNDLGFSIDDSNSDENYDPLGSLANDTWTLIHVSYSTGGSGRVRMFRDGVQVLDVADDGAINNTSDAVAIGHNTGSGRHWRGSIDHVTIQDTPRGIQWILADSASQLDTMIGYRCDSEPGLGGVVHDQDADGVPCDIDCNDGDDTIGAFWDDDDADGEGGALSSTCSAGGGVVDNNDDCDDSDPNVNTAADEVCNGKDDDCDGTIDQGASDETTWYLDSDGDGEGDVAFPVSACDAPTGYVANADDCDDADVDVNTGGDEVCNGIDDDCDGTADQGASDESTWYADADGDGFGDPADSLDACVAPSGYLLDDTDCDDTSSGTNPSADEICNGKDDDCDGNTDEDAIDASTWYADTDGDGFGDLADSVIACVAPSDYVSDSTDCDDSSNQAFPGGTEVCDGLDNDCNGPIDDGATDEADYFRDFDGDGFGSAANATTACSPPTGFVLDDTDCDDALDTVFPGATESCNSIDDDCDGTVDEGLTSLRYPDADGDLIGANVVAVEVCDSEPGYVDDTGDCDDNDPLVGEALTYFRDQDGDLYGDDLQTLTQCTPPPNWVLDGGDCNDLEPLAFPGNPENCDNVDNDCDGQVDEGAQFAPSWYPDADGDGHGESGSTAVQACSAPPDHAASFDDCDDTDPATFPGAAEACNGEDNDCDGVVDSPGVVDRFWFVDDDGDGFGDQQGTVEDCAPPPGQVGQAGDCDDGDAAVNPNATEICNGIDDDCDGTTDQGAADALTFFADYDGDGFGYFPIAVQACAAPSSFVSDNTDCNDSSNVAFPGGNEVCDTLDNDCNGVADDGPDRVDLYPDVDGDGFGDATLPPMLGCPTPGFVTDNTDCNDLLDSVYPPAGADPGAPEICDLADNDCDQLVDDADPDVVATNEFYNDLDGDGFGDGSSVLLACSAPAGAVADDTDCDDGDASIAPDQVDIPGNGVDEDCDGTDAIAPIETADTAAPADTDDSPPAPVDTMDTAVPVSRPPPPERTGCRCDQSGTHSVLWGGVLALVALRRRSRRE